jgi:hypothetical protein
MGFRPPPVPATPDAVESRACFFIIAVTLAASAAELSTVNAHAT